MRLARPFPRRANFLVGKEDRHLRHFQHVPCGPPEDGFAETRVAIGTHDKTICVLVAYMTHQNI